MHLIIFFKVSFKGETMPMLMLLTEESHTCTLNWTKQGPQHNQLLLISNALICDSLFDFTKPPYMISSSSSY